MPILNLSQENGADKIGVSIVGGWPAWRFPEPEERGGAPWAGSILSWRFLQRWGSHWASNQPLRRLQRDAEEWDCESTCQFPRWQGSSGTGPGVDGARRTDAKPARPIPERKAISAQARHAVRLDSVRRRRGGGRSTHRVFLISRAKKRPAVRPAASCSPGNRCGISFSSRSFAACEREPPAPRRWW